MALADSEDFEGIKRLLASWRDQERKLVERLEGEQKSATTNGVRIEVAASLASIRDHLHLANRVTLSAALQQSIARITIRKELRRRSFTTVKVTSGEVEFLDVLTRRGPIPFSDRELDPEQPYVRIADYVQRAGRPVRVTELTEAFSLKTAGYHARRAGLAGLIEYVPGAGWRTVSRS